MTTVRVALVYVGAPESPTHPVMSPPVGVQLLGTVLRAEGFVVDVFDSRLQSRSELDGLIAAYDPAVVGLSFLSPSSGEAIELGRALRAAGRFVVAGGVHASIHTGELLRVGAADTVVRREGERAIVDICRTVADGGTPPPVVVGQPVQDMDSLPYYAPFDCYDRRYAAAAGFSPVYLQLGRGCPMHCTFCELPNTDVFDPPRRRFKSLDRAMAEVHTYVQRWGVNFVTIVDSIATLNLPLITGLVRRMDEELPHVGLMFNGHVNRFSRELAEQIGRAQRHRDPDSRITVWFGFESGSQRLLNFMRKETRIDRAVGIAALCHEYDVQIGANLLLGVPTETPEDYQAHDAFMAAVRPTFPNPNILNPLPGTQMYDYCVAHGLLNDPTDYSIWSHEKIRARGAGPVRGVDYGRVLDAYYRYRADDAPPEAPRYEPWAEQP